MAKTYRVLDRPEGKVLEITDEKKTYYSKEKLEEEKARIEALLAELEE